MPGQCRNCINESLINQDVHQEILLFFVSFGSRHQPFQIPHTSLGHFWDANPENPGDYDLNISSPTMADQMNAAGISPSEKYGVFTTRSINANYPALDEFQQKWSDVLGRDVNFVGYPDAPPVRDPTEYILRSSE